LNALTSIGGDLSVNNNKALTSLAGLDNIDAGSIHNLDICDNAFLSTCAVKSVCNYLISSNGTTVINGNATGCNSQAEVDTACRHLSAENLSIDGNFSISPNPASTQITISTPTKGYFSILNLGGQQLLQQEITKPKTQIDISILPTGVYFVRLMDEWKVQVAKFIKQE